MSLRRPLFPSHSKEVNARYLPVKWCFWTVDFSVETKTTWRNFFFLCLSPFSFPMPNTQSQPQRGTIVVTMWIQQLGTVPVSWCIMLPPTLPWQLLAGWSPGSPRCREWTRLHRNHPKSCYPRTKSHSRKGQFKESSYHCLSFFLKNLGSNRGLEHAQ